MEEDDDDDIGTIYICILGVIYAASRDNNT
jgi:hypothetical protein